MRQSARLDRLFLVTGLLGGLAMLAYQPAPPAKVAAPKPVAAQVVPVFLIDREPRATAGDGNRGPHSGETGFRAPRRGNTARGSGKSGFRH